MPFMPNKSGLSGPSGGGLLTRRVFPRTDFPQDGWINSVANPPLDPAISTSAVAQLASSFKRSQSQTWDMGATTLVVVPEETRWPGVFQSQRESFRLRGRDQRPRNLDWDLDGWLAANLPAPFDPATVAAWMQQTESFRLPRQASQLGREPWKIRVSPIQGGLVELFPATWAMIPDVLRLPKRKWPTYVPMTTDWIVANLTIFDPAVQMPWFEPTERRWERERRPRQTEPQSIWMPVPVYDPALWPGTITMGERLRGRDQRPRFSEWMPSYIPAPIYDASLFMATTQALFRLANRDQRPRGLDPLAGSLVPAPLYDTSLFIATTQALFRMAARDRRPRGLDPLAGSLVPAPIFDPALFQAALFDRLRGRDQRPRLSEMGGPGLPIFDPAFFPTLLAEALRARRTGRPSGEHLLGLEPPVAPFDPAFFQPILAEIVRARRRGLPLGEHLLGLEPPTVAFDPALFQNILAELVRARRRGLPLGDVTLGLVPPAPTFDPAFWPAIEALLRVERQRGRPAFPWWATDLNWVEGIEEAPTPIVVTPPSSPQGRPSSLSRRFELLRWDEEILLFLRRNLRP